MSDQPPEVSNAYLEKLLTALAEGPIGQHILDVAEGRRRIVVRQNRDAGGWVVETEAVEPQTYEHVRLDQIGTHRRSCGCSACVAYREAFGAPA